jgi:hypothetical protein
VALWWLYLYQIYSEDVNNLKNLPKAEYYRDVIELPGRKNIHPVNSVFFTEV